MKKSILLIYHFFHPDTVISARLFSDLAEELARSGHRVRVFTGNRLIRSDAALSGHEEWNGVEIERFSRWNFSQGSNFGRLFNSGILQLKWLAAFFRKRKEFDVVIMGTDPQFSYFMFPFLRMMNRKVRLILWAFDLYPEAILVDSPKWMKLLAGSTRLFIPWAYRRVDDMVDIGSCMRERLQKYRHRAECATLTPWALVEPERIPEADPVTRRELFGDAKLGLLYSGTVGYAHDLEPFIALARECRRRKLDVAFCFAGYGNRYRAQTSKLTAEDTNIRLAGFASEDELQKRLAAADMHLVSLRRGWEGIVVPSKFFGSLAMGRPVLFSGPPESSISRWCESLEVGFAVTRETPSELEKLLSEPQRMGRLRRSAFECYWRDFSRKAVLERWKALLLPEGGGALPAHSK